MKLGIKELLTLSSDSNSFGGMSDALSMIVDSTQKKYCYGRGVELSDEQLGMVAGGVGSVDETGKNNWPEV